MPILAYIYDLIDQCLPTTAKGILTSKFFLKMNESKTLLNECKLFVGEHHRGKGCDNFQKTL